MFCNYQKYLIIILLIIIVFYFLNYIPKYNEVFREHQILDEHFSDKHIYLNDLESLNKKKTLTIGQISFLKNIIKDIYVSTPKELELANHILNKNHINRNHLISTRNVSSHNFVKCIKNNKLYHIVTKNNTCPIGYKNAYTIKCVNGAEKLYVTSTHPRCPKNYINMTPYRVVTPTMLATSTSNIIPSTMPTTGTSDVIPSTTIPSMSPLTSNTQNSYLNNILVEEEEDIYEINILLYDIDTISNNIYNNIYNNSYKNSNINKEDKQIIINNSKNIFNSSKEIKEIIDKDPIDLINLKSKYVILESAIKKLYDLSMTTPDTYNFNKYKIISNSMELHKKMIQLNNVIDKLFNILRQSQSTNNRSSNTVISDNSPSNNSLTNTVPSNNSLTNTSQSDNSPSNNGLSNNSLINTVPSNTVPSNNSSSNTSPSNNISSNTSSPNNNQSNTVPSNNSLTNTVPSNTVPSNTVPSNNSLTNNSLTNTVPSNTVPSNNSLTNTSLSNTSPSNNSPSNTSPSNNSPSNNSSSNNSSSNTSPSNNISSNTSPSNNSPSNNSPSNMSPSNTVPSNTSPSNTIPSNNISSNTVPSNNSKSNNSLLTPLLQSTAPFQPDSSGNCPIGYSNNNGFCSTSAPISTTTRLDPKTTSPSIITNYLKSINMPDIPVLPPVLPPVKIPVSPPIQSPVDTPTTTPPLKSAAIFPDSSRKCPSGYSPSAGLCFLSNNIPTPVKIPVLPPVKIPVSPPIQSPVDTPTTTPPLKSAAIFPDSSRKCPSGYSPSAGLCFLSNNIPTPVKIPVSPPIQSPVDTPVITLNNNDTLINNITNNIKNINTLIEKINSNNNLIPDKYKNIKPYIKKSYQDILNSSNNILNNTDPINLPTIKVEYNNNLKKSIDNLYTLCMNNNDIPNINYQKENTNTKIKIGQIIIDNAKLLNTENKKLAININKLK